MILCRRYAADKRKALTEKRQGFSFIIT